MVEAEAEGRCVGELTMVEAEAEGRCLGRIDDGRSRG